MNATPGDAEWEVIAATIELPDGRKFSDLSITIWDTKVPAGEKRLPSWAAFVDTSGDVAGAIVLGADTCEIRLADGRTGTARVVRESSEGTGSRVNFWGIGPLRPRI